MQTNSPDSSSSTDRNEAVNTLTKKVLEDENNNPYDVLGLEPDSSWQDIQKKFTEVQQTLNTKVSDLHRVSLDESNRRVDAHSEIKWAINKLQEMHFQRPEFLSEAQDLPTLLHRFDILAEHGFSFQDSAEGLSSNEGTRGQILNLMRDVYANPDIKLLAHNFIMISDQHNERSLFERELPKFREMVKELKRAKDLATITRVLKLFKVMKYENIPIWRDGKPAFISVTEELLRIEVKESSTNRNKGENFSRIFEEQLKKRIGIDL